MEHDAGPSYDSFVIRLWHDVASERLLRAEIDHVQTGAVYVGRDILPGWIVETLRASVQHRGDISATTRSQGIHPGQESDDV